MNKNSKGKKGEPLSFRRLKEIEYTAYSKVGKSSFYKTKDYELFQFYKSISNI